jgi:tetratricopeptide (TPR) repeat protein
MYVSGNLKQHSPRAMQGRIPPAADGGINPALQDHMNPRSQFRGPVILLLWAMLCGPAAAEDPAAVLHREAVALYDAGRFEDAAALLERALETAPGDSRLYHWLGKAYGRWAEIAPWYRAMTLARQTRLAFETAVRMDGTNIDALEDLMLFYRSAPAFLGGDEEKARAIAARLEQLNGDQTPDDEPGMSPM